MSFTVVSCAMFNQRKDRGRSYYDVLLNDFRAKTDLPMIVYTNDPAAFGPGMEIRHVPDVTEYRKRLDPDPEFQNHYIERSRWSRRNRKLAQVQNPALTEIYLAKMAMLSEAVRDVGNVFWLDAGLLFSIRYSHKVPEVWEGYSAERIRQSLIPAFEHRSEPLLNVFQPVAKFGRDFRPSFHGMSRFDMRRYARRLGIRRDPLYVMAGTLFATPRFIDLLDAEFPTMWRELARMNRPGSEETVLTALRWKHNLPGERLLFWETLLLD